MSATELSNRYFFGIPLIDQNGNQLSDDSIAFYINAATQAVEGWLNLKVKKQIVEENLSYHYNDFCSWGYIPVSYPIIEAKSLTGFIGNIEQVVYPAEWLSVKKSTDPTAMQRNIYLVPTSGQAQHNSVVYSGIVPNAGWLARANIPNYWTVRYVSGFDRIPEDLLDYIGKLAAINIFHQLGDIILGAGIASQSIGIDGLSQSISTTSSATNAGYGARITGYISDLKTSKAELKNKYDGMILLSM